MIIELLRKLICPNESEKATVAETPDEDPRGYELEWTVKEEKSRVAETSDEDPREERPDLEGQRLSKGKRRKDRTKDRPEIEGQPITKRP